MQMTSAGGVTLPPAMIRLGECFLTGRNGRTGGGSCQFLSLSSSQHHSREREHASHFVGVMLAKEYVFIIILVCWQFRESVAAISQIPDESREECHLIFFNSSNFYLFLFSYLVEYLCFDGILWQVADSFIYNSLFDVTVKAGPMSAFQVTNYSVPSWTRIQSVHLAPLTVIQLAKGPYFGPARLAAQ